MPMRMKMDRALEKIYKSALNFLAPLTPEELYKTIVNEAVNLVGANYGSLLLERNRELQQAYSTLPLTIKRRRNGNAYRSYREGAAFVAQSKDFGANRPQALRDLGIRSNIFIPLAYREKSIGVLIVNSKKEQRFTFHELNILKLFGSMASLAIRKTELYEETKKALETRDLFISLASHELRTPLTSINGYIQLLKNKIPENKIPEGKWIYQLWRESVRLTGLVAELLEINRIKAGRLQYIWKESDLKAIVNRAVATFSTIHPNRKVNFIDNTAGETAFVVADFDKLIQVVSNLLVNAEKFSPKDRDITLILTNRSSSFFLKIIDKGIGFPPKFLSKAFDPFAKGDNNTQEGMGIGLYITKDIITRHRGAIKIRSKEGRGTAVTIKLPKAKV